MLSPPVLAFPSSNLNYMLHCNANITKLCMWYSKRTQIVSGDQPVFGFFNSSSQSRTISHRSWNALQSYGRWRRYVHTSSGTYSPFSRAMHCFMAFSLPTTVVANLSVLNFESPNLTSNAKISKPTQVRMQMDYALCKDRDNISGSILEETTLNLSAIDQPM